MGGWVWNENIEAGKQTSWARDEMAGSGAGQGPPRLVFEDDEVASTSFGTQVWSGSDPSYCLIPRDLVNSSFLKEFGG